MNMCRFNGDDDDGYVKIKGALELAISEISSVLRQDHDPEKVNLIYPVDPSNFKNDIIGEDNQLLENTGSWIFKGTTTTVDGDSGRKQSRLAAEAFAKWVNHDLPRVLWIKGEPGKGKTMLAISVVDELQRRNQFNVAHFFCKNSEDKRNTAVDIIESILRQIYSWQPELLSHFDACEKDLRGMTKPDWKFSTLWKVLENTIKDSKFRTSYFVIDGLDECDDTSAVLFLERLRRMNFELGKEINHRTKVQWLITSRDEGVITRELREFQPEKAFIISLEDNSEEVRKSVEQYIANRVRKLAVQEGYDRSLQAIVEDEGIRFYIRLCRSFLRIQSDIVSIKHQSVKDYLVPMRCAGACPREYDFKVLYHPNPARCPCAHRLLLPGNYPSVDRASVVFPIDEVEGHRAILLRSIDSMTEVLRKDIYNLSQPSCSIAEVEVPDPDPLASIRYACAYWIDHLSAIESCHDGVGFGDIGKINRFLEKQVLYWLEAMSLMESIPEAIAMLMGLESAIVRDKQHDEQRNLLSSIVYDAKRFTLAFKSITEIYPLQIYNSALLFSPAKSTIRNGFSKEIPAWVQNQRLPVLEENWTPYLHTLEGHTRTVCSVAFSPDGSLLASGSWDHTVRLWNPITGAALHTLEGHLGSVRDMAFSPNGVELASCVYNWVGQIDPGPVRVWDPTSGTAIHKLGADVRGFVKLVFSADGNQIVSGSVDNTVYVWDAAKGTVRHILKCDGNLFGITCLAFSPDGSQLAAGLREFSAGLDKVRDDPSLYMYLWDLSTGKRLHLMNGHVGGVRTLSFSPNGKQLASGSEDGVIQLREPTRGRLLYTLTGDGPIKALAFSPDSRRLASLSKTIQLWDPTTGVAQQTLQDHSGRYEYLLKFSPDGSTLACASGNILLLYDSVAGTMLHMLEGHSDTICALAFSPNGRQLASASGDGTVRLWDPTAKALPLHQKANLGTVDEVIFSSDGNRLASLTIIREIQLWDLATGAELCNIAADSIHKPHIIAFSPNGEELVSGSYDGSVCIWDPVTGAALKRLSHPDGPVAFNKYAWRQCLALSPNVSSPVNEPYGRGCAIRLWDYTTGVRLHRLEGHTSNVIGLVFSPDGSRLASRSRDRTIRLWDTATGVMLHTLESHTTPAHVMAFSPNSSRLASSSTRFSTDESIRIWDLAAGELLYMLDGSPDKLAFSADGNHLLSGHFYKGNKSKLWDLSTRAVLDTLDCHPVLVAAAASWNSQDKSQALYLLDSSGRWITRNNQKVILLPHDQRARACSIWGKKLAIGRHAGGVKILEFE
ncbi:hypothetical protein F4824DRAFT_74847 [Ustulina deusta]|nr:hypothetical protein F4824DRAFT_74847 [Ustulina deusta]